MSPELQALIDALALAEEATRLGVERERRQRADARTTDDESAVRAAGPPVIPEGPTSA
jgi:hypothetical protein